MPLPHTSLLCWPRRHAHSTRMARAWHACASPSANRRGARAIVPPRLVRACSAHCGPHSFLTHRTGSSARCMPSTTRAAACRSMASSWSPRIAAPLRKLRRQRSPAAAGAGGIHVRRWAERSASGTGCPRTCPATAHLARAPCSERLGAAEVRAVSARAHPSIHPSARVALLGSTQPVVLHK